MEEDPTWWRHREWTSREWQEFKRKLARSELLWHESDQELIDRLSNTDFDVNFEWIDSEGSSGDSEDNDPLRGL